jgi:hypothetical protein
MLLFLMEALMAQGDASWRIAHHATKTYVEVEVWHGVFLSKKGKAFPL